MAHGQTTKYGADGHTIHEPSRAGGEGTSYLQAGNPGELHAALRTEGVSTARGSTASDLVRALLHDSSTSTRSQHDGQWGLSGKGCTELALGRRTNQAARTRASELPRARHLHRDWTAMRSAKSTRLAANGGLVTVVEMGALAWWRRAKWRPAWTMHGARTGLDPSPRQEFTFLI